jgi:hypothetical protein
MTSLPGLTVDVDQNPYLPAGGRDVSAVVTATVDEATGTVRLKKKVDAADEMALDTRSTKTVRVARASNPHEAAV